MLFKRTFIIAVLVVSLTTQAVARCQEEKQDGELVSSMPVFRRLLVSLRLLSVAHAKLKIECRSNYMFPSQQFFVCGTDDFGLPA